MYEIRMAFAYVGTGRGLFCRGLFCRGLFCRSLFCRGLFYCRSGSIGQTSDINSYSVTTGQGLFLQS
ncbi:MAG: hypothetical protein ABI707_10880, partial [Ferruginibacter sp.]